MIKECIIFAVGALVGTGATVLIMRKKYDEKYNKLLKDAINSDADFRLREANKKLAEAKALQSGYIQSSGEEKPETDKKLEKVDTIDRNESNQKKSGDSKIGKPNYVDYTSYYEAKVANEYPREEYEKAEESAYSEADKLNNSQDSNKQPKIVSKEEFDSAEYEYYDKATLYFYKEDQVLATEDDEVIEDPFKYVGNALDKYGFRNNSENVIYVRNYKFNCDYEIDKIENSFAETKWCD